jgi:isopropylmalate/homocitrate/citramalate synthase
MAEYFRKDIGYNIPVMTPFVGKNFNSTRAGIHADGLMKDAEIYTIFDTKKLLNRPATVEISKTSGLAGLAYWINQNYSLPEDKMIAKNDPLVYKLKEWVDAQYETGRQTSISRKELEEKIEETAPRRFAEKE